MKKQVFDTKDYLFYLIVAPLFFFLSRQYLQVHEDLGYAFSLVDGSPISGFSDAMASQAWAWMHTVARFAVLLLYNISVLWRTRRYSLLSVR